MIEGILEPPPYHTIPPPYVSLCLPEPPPYYSVPSLYPIPSPSRFNLESNALDWDMVDHLSLMSRRRHSISSRALYELAVDMPLPYITITSPYLPWNINVRASNNSYITLEDVYGSIYLKLHTNIARNEFSTLKSESDQRRATRADEERYRRHRGVRTYYEEKWGGMKRIDFLMGRTRFLGISNNGRHPDEWQLNVI